MCASISAALMLGAWALTPGPATAEPDHVLYKGAAGTTGDGQRPIGTVAWDGVGNRLYGVTELGRRYNEGCRGTLFSVTAQGVETVLHSFGGPGDGSQPEGGVTLVGDTLYGLTGSGGAYNQGVAWMWSPSGGYKVLHSFSGPEGSGPLGGLIFADGDLYGTTFAGSANGYGASSR
jgi:uncharacterized repeat protein (TIGR03803 family)